MQEREWMDLIRLHSNSRGFSTITSAQTLPSHIAGCVVASHSTAGSFHNQCNRLRSQRSCIHYCVMPADSSKQCTLVDLR